MQLADKEWICFEKSGRVTDYLAYCQSVACRYSEFESEKTGRWEQQHGFERCEHQEKLSKGHMKMFCSNFVIFFW